MTETTLPPRQPVGSEIKDVERLYRTALNTRDYLRLEVESMERGLKPFGLTKSVMTLYLHKKLIYVSDLPQALQVQINDYYKAAPKKA